MKKKILITGGSGFIGSKLKDSLSKSNFEILTIGRSEKEDVKIDLREEKLRTIIEKFLPDIVFHFASGSNIRRAAEDKDKEFNDTVIGTKNLINSLPKSVKIVYLSSQAVYGIPEYLPVNESHKTKPITGYGKNKLEAENLIINSKLNYLIFRVSSVFGPGQDYKKSGVIANFVNKMKNNEPPIVFNDYDVSCDFIYIKDLISVMMSIVQNEEVQNEIFNLGSGKLTSLKELLALLYKYFPLAPKSKLEINPLYPDKKHKDLCLDTKKIQTYLKWSAKYTLEDGLKEMLENVALIKK